MPSSNKASVGNLVHTKKNNFSYGEECIQRLVPTMSQLVSQGFNIENLPQNFPRAINENNNWIIVPSKVKAHSHLMQLSADSAVDCVDAEI